MSKPSVSASSSGRSPDSDHEGGGADPSISRLRKQLARFENGIQSRSSELAQLRADISKFTVCSRLNIALSRMVRRSTGPFSADVFTMPLDELIAILEGPEFKHIFGQDNVFSLTLSEIKRKIKRCEVLEGELKKMLETKAVIERDLGKRRDVSKAEVVIEQYSQTLLAIQNVLATSKDGLSACGGAIGCSDVSMPPPSSGPVLPVPSASTTNGGNKRPSNPVKGPSRLGLVEQTEGPELRALRLLREAVTIGNQVGALRLMIPNSGQVRVKHERDWVPLFKALGFSGNLIIAPTYESLRRGMAPIVMPRTMHTHTDRWKRHVTAPLFVIDFAHPKALLAVLNNVK